MTSIVSITSRCSINTSGRISVFGTIEAYIYFEFWPRPHCIIRKFETTKSKLLPSWTVSDSGLGKFCHSKSIIALYTTNTRWFAQSRRPSMTHAAAAGYATNGRSTSNGVNPESRENPNRRSRRIRCDARCHSRNYWSEVGSTSASVGVYFVYS